MYDSRLAAPSTILFVPKYGRDVWLTGTSPSLRPCTMIVGFAAQISGYAHLTNTRLQSTALALDVVHNCRKHCAPRDAKLLSAR